MKGKARESRKWGGGQKKGRRAGSKWKYQRKKKTRQMRLRKVKTWTTDTERLRVGCEVKGNVRELRCVAGQDYDADSPLCHHMACPLLH